MYVNDVKTLLLEMSKNRWLPFVIGIPLFFCVNRYDGIIWDAVLYLLQVVNSFDPSRFIDDPPFMFGNQDSYGFFTPLYRIFINLFGVSNGTLGLCFLSQLLFAVNIILFVKYICKCAKIQMFVLPMLLLLVFVTAYGMPNTYTLFVRFVQQYNCSRLLSMALGVGGIAFLLGGKKWLSLLSILLGTIVHPLTAGWGLPVWLFFYYPRLRLPVVVLSTLAPLTFLLHHGVFDFYPEDWMKKPLLYAPQIWDILKQVVYIVFFWNVERFCSTKILVDVSKSVTVVLLLALYWNIWGGLQEHVLFYQLQTWRVDWLAVLLTFPFFFAMCAEQLKLFHQSSVKLLLKDFFESKKCLSLVLFGLSALLPYHSLLILLAAFLINGRACQKIMIKKEFYAGCCVVVCILLASYQSICLAVSRIDFVFPFLVNEFLSNVDVICSLLYISLLFVVVWTVYAIFEKKWLIAALMIVFAFFPQLVFFPTIAMLVFLKPWIKKKKNFYMMLVCLVLFAVCDALLCYEEREFEILKGIYDVDSKIVVGIVVCFSLFAYGWLKCGRLKKWSPVPVVAFMVFGTSFAFASWDMRKDDAKIFEKNLDEFYSQSIFPQIKNRGRVFFYVTGLNAYIPRLQFLSGAYLSYNTHIGEIFFKGQFEESVKRDNYLYYKEQKNIVNEKQEYKDFVEHELVNRDTLIDRMSFLCSINEIDFVVSDEEDLLKKKLDSYVMNNGQKVFLYECK